MTGDITSLLAEALARRPLRTLLEAAREYQATTNSRVVIDDNGARTMTIAESLARSERIIRLMAWDASWIAAQERRRQFHIVETLTEQRA